MRYRVEQFLSGDWVLMADSDDYRMADDSAHVLLHGGAKKLRIVDTRRPELSDQVVWSMTTK